MTFTLTIPGRICVPCASLAEASAAYCKAREASNEGASTFPDGAITKPFFADGSCPRIVTHVGRVSYNGKVWGPDDWLSGMKPLFDPYADQSA